MSQSRWNASWSCLATLATALALWEPAPLRAADLSLPGPHFAGHFDLDVPRTGSSDTFRVRMFYPALAPGESTPLDLGGGPYPAVSFGHGFLQTVDPYTSTLEHLASWGYFVMAPLGNQGLIPNQKQFADEMQDSLDYLVAQTATPGSFFYGGVAADRLGVSGHSMGGAASIRIAAQDSRIRAVANLAAANVFANPSPIELMPQVMAPIKLIAGSDDLIAPPRVHQQPMYDNGGPPKLLSTLVGGCHAYFEDYGPQITDGSTLGRGEQLALSRRELTTFFNFYLQGDQSLWREVWGPQATDDPLVQIASQSGIGLAASATQLSTVPGQAAEFLLTVTNQGRVPAQYDLLAEDQLWLTTFSDATTLLLAPGQSAQVTVRVTPPEGAFDQSDQVLFSARSSVDGLTRNWLYLNTTTPPAPEHLVGDANGDCTVGAADYALWAAQFGQTGAGLSADFDGSGEVGAGDYALWAANFGKTCPAAAAAVPEPTACRLLGTALAGLFGLAARRKPFRRREPPGAPSP